MKPLLIASLFFAISCSAQTSPAAAKPAAPAPATFKPIKFRGVVFSGSLRARMEGFDWFEPASGDNAYVYSGNLLRFGFSKKLETWDWNAEFAAPILLGLPANPVGPGAQGALGVGANYLLANNRNQNAAMIFPKQLYARISKFGNSTASTLKLGRFEFQDGSETTSANATLANLKANRINQRLIGPFGFSDVGRSFDGLQYSYAKPVGTFTFVGAVPTRGVFQVDGWGWNKVAFGYGSFNKAWGSKGRHAGETRLFVIYYDDWRHVVKTDNRAAGVRAGDFANIKLWTSGGNSVHQLATRAGTLDALVWGVAQGGQWGVQRQEAFAFDVEGGFQPKLLPKLKPWVRGGYSVTSGDNNPADNKHETFFQILPTVRPYAKFPFFNMENNIDRFGSLVLRPHAKVTVSTEFHSLALASAKDLWYSGGGVFQPWTFGYQGRATGGAKSLANLYDANVEYRYSPRVAVLGYYGYAQGKSAIAAIYPKGKDGSFGYLELTLRF